MKARWLIKTNTILDKIPILDTVKNGLRRVHPTVPTTWEAEKKRSPELTNLRLTRCYIKKQKGIRRKRSFRLVRWLSRIIPVAKHDSLSLILGYM